MNIPFLFPSRPDRTIEVVQIELKILLRHHQDRLESKLRRQSVNPAVCSDFAKNHKLWKTEGLLHSLKYIKLSRIGRFVQCFTTDININSMVLL